MVDGGLASQITKYYIGRFIKAHHSDAIIKYDVSWFDKYGVCVDGINPRNFDLIRMFPDIDFPIATGDEIRLLKKHYCYKNPNVYGYNTQLERMDGPCYIDGYFSNWRYYLDSTQLVIPETTWANHVNQSKLSKINLASHSVAVHVRRGDFKTAIMGVLPEDYFVNAMQYVQKKLSDVQLNFFIFTNDVAWCEDSLRPKIPPSINYTIMSQEKESNAISDFCLMSKCHHQICSNSGFSYFSASFNQNLNKLVVVPDQWILNLGKGYEGIDLNQINESLHPSYVQIKV